MPFHRFEDMENKNFTLHLSSARGPVIEGSHLYFCLNQKEAGTGSELHYHPNELLIFVVRGKVNARIGASLSRARSSSSRPMCDTR
jgi:oxalate decarboxylase/phosphoglucose isomerase-like protein (cupin superfamily)